MNREGRIYRPGYPQMDPRWAHTIDTRHERQPADPV